MDLLVLNKELDPIDVCDTYTSLVWSDRYYEYGDFEIYTIVSTALLNILKEEFYIQRLDSDHAMIIENVQVSPDIEDGNKLIVTGRSLESILARRIIWGRTSVKGNFQNGIKQLLDECIISPSDPLRKIDNFIFEESTDPTITELTIDAQYTGDNLYDVISNTCMERGIGFKIFINDYKQFVFRLYSGQDRSYEQFTNPYVVFSPNFENLMNSNYLSSKKDLKNNAFIAGEGEGTDRKTAYVIDGSGGLDRRELYVDARDISSNIGDGVTLTDDEYTAKLQTRGAAKLAEHTSVVSFEGQAETNIMFKYGEDFFIGDIVQIANEYGHEARARILELITSEDTGGITVYPTFKTL